MKCLKRFGVVIQLSLFFILFVAGGVVVSAEDTAPVINLDPNNIDAWNGKPGIFPNFETVFPIKGEPIHITDKDAILTDAEEDAILWLTATITNDSAIRTGDVLAADNTDTSISITYNASEGVLTMTGTDTPENYQKVLRTITFQNSSDAPDQTARRILLQASDNKNVSSNEVASSVRVLGFAGTFEEDQDPLILTSDNSIKNINNETLASATITLVNVQSDDKLTADVSGTSITSDYKNGVLTLSGEDTPENYLKILSEKISFENTSQNPDPRNRIVRMAINDGVEESNATWFLVAVVSVNDAPVNTLPGSQTPSENTALVFGSDNGNLIAVADADAGNANIQVKLNVDYGTLTVSEDSEAQIDADGTSDVTISGTIAQINAALDGLTYTPETDRSGEAKLKIITNDMGNTGGTEALSDSDTLIIAVGGTVNPDVPVANAGVDQSVNEGDSVLLDGTDSYDPDGTITAYLWEQTSGTSVTIEKPTSERTTFIAPDAGKSQITLTFTLTVKDDKGLEHTDSMGVTVKAQGVVSFTSSTDKSMWLKPGNGESLTSLNRISYDSISGDDKPEDMIYGLIETEVMVSNPGDTATITIFLPQAAPTGYSWYKYQNNKWSYYDSTVFNTDRTQVKLTIKDGGEADNDGAANSYVKDISGLGKPKGTTTDPGDNNNSTGEPGDDTNGCFINTVLNGN